MRRDGLTFEMRHEDLSYAQSSTGELHYRSRWVWFRGRRYTSRGMASYLVNEVLRKNSNSVTRTVSSRRRAGSRRTKRYARLARVPR